MNIITLVMGDPSHDGHNIEEKITYNSNYTIKQITEAYRESCNILGFSFIDDCREEYENSLIPEYMVNKFIEVGILHKAPCKTEDGYCPEPICSPCYSSFCVRESDWVQMPTKKEYIYEDGKYLGIKEIDMGLGLNMDSDNHADIYIAIVKLTLGNLVMERCSNYNNEIDIGGYGLFSV